MKPDRKPRSFGERQAWLPNLLALSYALGGYALSFLLLARPGVGFAADLGLAVAGVLLASHSMFIAAYLLHEALHRTLFAGRRANQWSGELLSFVAGSSYASYQRLQRLHLRHHLERADVVCFDYKAFLRRQPRWVQSGVLALEWLYVPAVETLMHLQVIVRPFVEPAQLCYLPRVALMLVLRLSLLAALGSVAPRALLLYFRDPDRFGFPSPATNRRVNRSALLVRSSRPGARSRSEGWQITAPNATRPI